MKQYSEEEKQLARRLRKEIFGDYDGLDHPSGNEQELLKEFRRRLQEERKKLKK